MVMLVHHSGAEETVDMPTFLQLDMIGKVLGHACTYNKYGVVSQDYSVTSISVRSLLV